MTIFSIQIYTYLFITTFMSLQIQTPQTHSADFLMFVTCVYVCVYILNDRCVIETTTHGCEAAS